MFHRRQEACFAEGSILKARDWRARYVICDPLDGGAHWSRSRPYFDLNKRWVRCPSIGLSPLVVNAQVGLGKCSIRAPGGIRSYDRLLVPRPARSIGSSK